MTRSDLLSMTGFGASERELPEGRLRVEIRTVNHRFLNLNFRTPSSLERHQGEIERRIRARFRRGQVSVTVSLDRSQARGGAAPVVVDLARAEAYRDALCALQAELGLGGTVGVELLAGFRELFQAPDPDRSGPGVELGVLGEVVEEAADQALEMRRAEGARLGEDLAARLDALETELDAVQTRAPERLFRERDRLRAAVAELMEGAAPVDHERIAREVAHLAERWDIHEELVRFRSHLRMFRDTLASGGVEGVGKRFGFIAQELLREANTIGSKANDPEISARVVTIKEEIERLREQLENVE
jgi:uncharacterized protein (TIGR00255 family)